MRLQTTTYHDAVQQQKKMVKLWQKSQELALAADPKKI